MENARIRVRSGTALAVRLVVLGSLLLATLAASSSPVSAEGATVTTDKDDYLPEETVVVTGTGFAPDTIYDVPVIRPDGSIVKGDGSFEAGWDSVTSDGTGSFVYYYKLNGIVGDYELRVYPSPWQGGPDGLAETPLATTTFTDAVSLQQCANGPADAPVDCNTPARWVITPLNATNSHYSEGRSVPYRLKLSSVPLAPSSVTIQWDSTNAGLHGTDYLTTFDRTEAGVGPCAGANCNPNTFTTMAIPLDPAVTVPQYPGVFTLYNGTINSVSGYTVTGANVTRTSITVSFTPTQINAVLAWSGHIASQAQWGVDTTYPTSTAVTKPLYRMRITNYNGIPVSQERTLATGAVQQDLEAPLCALTIKTWSQIQVTAQDTVSGLNHIGIAKQVNITVSLPTFHKGNTDEQVVMGDKKDLSKSASLTLKVTDTAGNLTICDPVVTIAIRDSGRPVTETFTELPAAEHLVTVSNGSPGLTSVILTVNGSKFVIDELAANEIRRISVASAMKPGDTNTISVTGSGKPGGQALVVISDS